MLLVTIRDLGAGGFDRRIGRGFGIHLEFSDQKLLLRELIFQRGQFFLGQ